MSSGSVIDFEIPYSVIVRISNETQASANPTRSHNNNNSTIDGVLLRQDVDKLLCIFGWKSENVSPFDWIPILLRYIEDHSSPSCHKVLTKSPLLNKPTATLSLWPLAICPTTFAHNNLNLSFPVGCTSLTSSCHARRITFNQLTHPSIVRLTQSEGLSFEIYYYYYWHFHKLPITCPTTYQSGQRIFTWQTRKSLHFWPELHGPKEHFWYLLGTHLPRHPFTVISDRSNCTSLHSHDILQTFPFTQ